MARSGTSLVSELLFNHFDYGMGPESSFIPEFSRKLRRYGDLRDSANLQRLAEDISRCEALEIARSVYPIGERFDVSPELILARMTTSGFSGIVRSILQCMADAQHRGRLGTKLPMFWKHIDLLEELFGQSARYLWVVRDGRDVALSLMKQPWGEKSAHACARHWVKSMESLRRTRQTIQGDRLLIVQYENLLSSPGDVLGRINQFTGVGLTETEVEAAVCQIRSQLAAENHAKWRNEMTPDDLRIFEGLASAHLKEWGYEVATKCPRISGIEHARFIVQEWLRRFRQAAT